MRGEIRLGNQEKGREGERSLHMTSRSQWRPQIGHKKVYYQVVNFLQTKRNLLQFLADFAHTARKRHVFPSLSLSLLSPLLSPFFCTPSYPSSSFSASLSTAHSAFLDFTVPFSRNSFPFIFYFGSLAWNLCSLGTVFQGEWMPRSPGEVILSVTPPTLPSLGFSSPPLTKRPLWKSSQALSVFAPLIFRQATQSDLVQQTGALQAKKLCALPTPPTTLSNINRGPSCFLGFLQ